MSASLLPILWIIIPCYCEEVVLPTTAPKFLDKLLTLIGSGRIDNRSQILFVNDGSTDKTWEIIKNLSQQDQHIIGISQSRNRGHQNAVLAGLMEAKDNCDIAITIDCDGQDDINAMDQMIEEYKNGNEIVYGVRSKRTTDTWFKRTTAESFYRILNLLGANVVYNHADYRLVSNKVLNHFADFHEVNLFLRGLFPLIGFNSTEVYYERSERIAGESHYPLKKMLGLAFDGITSLTIKPITLISIIGLTILVLGFLFSIGTVIYGAACGAVSDWVVTLCIASVFCGLQMLSTGIVGTYVGKAYLETKHRPRYIISERTFDPKQKTSINAD